MNHSPILLNYMYPRDSFLVSMCKSKPFLSENSSNEERRQDDFSLCPSVGVGDRGYLV